MEGLAGCFVSGWLAGCLEIFSCWLVALSLVGWVVASSVVGFD